MKKIALAKLEPGTYDLLVWVWMETPYSYLTGIWASHQKEAVQDKTWW